MNGRTPPLTLILLGLAAGAIAWAIESWLVASGRAMFVAPLTMPVTLVLVAVVLLVLAWPIRVYTRGLRRRGRAEGDEARAAADADARRNAGDRAPREPLRDERAPKRVDPLAAVRVLALAKASSLSASVLGGGAAAVLVFVLTRPVIGEPLLGPGIAGVVGPSVLLAAGLLAESWCVLPPDDREGAASAAAPPRPLLES